MATVLVSWELGGGMGHLTRLLPLVQGLADRGHRVALAAQNIVSARRVFARTPVMLLQAPIRTRPRAPRIDNPRSFAHVLHNSGFGCPEELAGLAAGWTSLFELIRPDLAVFDHCPSGLLASRCFPAKRVPIGTGFCCPAIETPYRDLRPRQALEPGQLERDEQLVLENANRVLGEAGGDRLGRLADLYAEVDDTILTTFAELDHYPDRGPARYWGTWTKQDGDPPQWPEGEGKRVFVYVSPFPAFPSLLAELNDSQCPTIVHAKEIPESLCRKLTSPTLRAVRELLDLSSVAETCDVAVLNGGHGTTASMLLGGKPILQIPLSLEQSMTANRVVRMQAGLAADRSNAKEMVAALRTLVQTDAGRSGARAFSERYADHRPDRALGRVLDRCESLLATG